MNLSELMRRKVFGIPIVYIAALFVAVLVFIAWRVKDVSGSANESPSDTGEESDVEGDVTPVGNPVFIANPSLTPSTGATATDTPSVDTNEAWAKRAIEWISAHNTEFDYPVSTHDAHRAVYGYLNSDALSIRQREVVDRAIRQFGLPPEVPTPGQTKTPNYPAARQGTPPTNHTVKYTTENDFWKLARLYYGSEHYDYVNFLEVANLGVVPKGKNAIPLGTRVKIPAYKNPKYYTSTKSYNTIEKIAARNGTSTAVIRELNDSINFNTALKPGTRVRVA